LVLSLLVEAYVEVQGNDNLNNYCKPIGQLNIKIRDLKFATANLKVIERGGLDAVLRCVENQFSLDRGFVSDTNYDLTNLANNAGDGAVDGILLLFCYHILCAYKSRNKRDDPECTVIVES
jgi:hypothetical protein